MPRALNMRHSDIGRLRIKRGAPRRNLYGLEKQEQARISLGARARAL